jgi:hypothetical protein
MSTPICYNAKGISPSPGRMVIVLKYYLVDSENVNDNWLLLLDMAEQDDKIIVFYTRNSPHMSYASVIRLLRENPSIQFEECHEGNQALDFQLVSYLGYLMGQEASKDAEYVIMSNDTGFDAVVTFWKEKAHSVNRINVNYCKLYLSRKKKGTAVDSDSAVEMNSIVEEVPTVEAVESTSKKASVTAKKASSKKEKASKQVAEYASEKASEKTSKQTAEHASKKTSKQASKQQYSFDKEEVDTLLNCLGKDHLSALHEVLVHVYGQNQGQKIYKSVKEKSYSVAEKPMNRSEKVTHFADIIFSHSELDEPEDFVDFLETNKAKSKNLNVMRPAIVKAYGEKTGMSYYSLFKPYFKILSAL